MECNELCKKSQSSQASCLVFLAVTVRAQEVSVSICNKPDWRWLEVLISWLLQMVWLMGNSWLIFPWQCILHQHWLQTMQRVCLEADESGISTYPIPDQCGDCGSVQNLKLVQCSVNGNVFFPSVLAECHLNCCRPVFSLAGWVCGLFNITESFLLVTKSHIWLSERKMVSKSIVLTR